jgi:hypothetical protein
MKVDLVRPCRLEPAMLVAGVVQMDAPTTPVQPFASALTVESIEPAANNGVRGFYIVWERLGKSCWYPLYGPALTFLVIAGGAK